MKVLELGQKAAGAKGLGTEKCQDCEALEAELAGVTQQRDLAIRALAEERERTDALRLNYPSSSHSVGSHVPPDAFKPPLRYAIADAANDWLKKYFRMAHGAIKYASSLASRAASQGERKRGP